MPIRHARPYYFVANREEVRGDTTRPATRSEVESAFRFSEMVKRGTPDSSPDLLRTLAQRMTAKVPEKDGDVPAGFTYLGQFIDHDLTRDVTRVAFGNNVTAAELAQGRSPALDLDSLYGKGPADAGSARFYEANGVMFRLGRTAAAGPAAGALDGFDLPRLGSAALDPAEARRADIADPRNDENLAVAQTHLAFLRFHNATVRRLSPGTPSALLFDTAREEVTLHYHWMIRHDFLPRIVERAVLDDVFNNGRKVFEVGAAGMPTMPIEFSVAAYRLGHSMIRDIYDWNEVFRAQAADPTGLGSLLNLFRFSGTSGNLNPGSNVDNPLEGTLETLVTIWVADWTRLYDFVADGAPAALAPHAGGVVNHARRIDTRMTDPLAQLPLGSFGGLVGGDPIDRNLAFRNLVRGRMVKLATAQEVAVHFKALGAATPMLTSEQILGPGDGGVDLRDLSATLKDEMVTATPLWFYVLREAEVKGGRLGPIGGRIVAETFHRAMEGSRISLLRRPDWRPEGGSHPGGFGMVDVLRRAFDGTKGELRVVSPGAPKG